MWKIAAPLCLAFAAPLCLAVVVGAAGCSDNNAPADMSVAVPHNFDQINSQVLQVSCANFSPCHSPSGASAANHLNLAMMNQDGTPNDPYAALVNVAAVNKKAASEGKLRVKPCDSQDSFVIIKLNLQQNQDLNTGYGHYMPDTNPHLDPAVIQGIADWIDRGALRNEPATVTGKTCMLGPDMAVAGAHD